MRTILLTTTALLFSLTSTNAQPGSGYAQRAIEDKYEKENSGNKAKGEAWLANMMNAKTEDTYTFPITLTMHVTDYKDGELKSEGDLKYFINGSKKYFAFLSEEKKKKKNKEGMFMIYDYNNNSMITLNQDEKTGMAININAFMSKAAQEKRGQAPTGKPDDKIKCNKTGKTKTIQGYPCVQHVCIDEDRNRRNEFWVTNKIDIDISQSLGRSPYAYLSESKSFGFLMGGDFYKNDQIDSKMEVTELNEKANVIIKISDYKMGMH